MRIQLFARTRTQLKTPRLRRNGLECFDGDQSMHEIAVSHYHGINTWAEGVRQAGSLDRMAIIEALETGISITGPGGKVTVDPKTHHAVLTST